MKLLEILCPIIFCQTNSLFEKITAAIGDVKEKVNSDFRFTKFTLQMDESADIIVSENLLIFSHYICLQSCEDE